MGGKREGSPSKGLGPMPDCIGHYLPGDQECDGPPSCSWRAGCRVYQVHCHLRSVDPEREKLVTPKEGIAGLIRTLQTSTRWARKYEGDNDLQHVYGWTRFLGAISSHPTALVVHRGREAAVPGEMFWMEWRRKGSLVSDLPTALLVKIRSGGAPTKDVTLLRYWPRKRRETMPDMDFRVPLAAIRTAFPEAKGICRNWSSSAARLGASWSRFAARAERVLPTRIEDAGRLLAALVVGGHFRGVRYKDGFFDLTWEATTPPATSRKPRKKKTGKRRRTRRPE